MKYIAIGDIHGEYKKLNQLIRGLDLKFNDEKIIFLGDYIDRGDDSAKVIKLVRTLQKTYPDNVICLRGNHEQMMIDYYQYGDSIWDYNGADCTRDSFLRMYGDNYKEALEDVLVWFETLPFYYEADNNIFVHGGINPSLPMENQNENYMLWAREDYLNDPRPFPKTVISGHTPTLCFDSEKPVKTVAGNINIDTGAVYGGKLTACIIDDSESKVKFISVGGDK